MDLPHSPWSCTKCFELSKETPFCCSSLYLNSFHTNSTHQSKGGWLWEKAEGNIARLVCVHPRSEVKVSAQVCNRENTQCSYCTAAYLLPFQILNAAEELTHASSREKGQRTGLDSSVTAWEHEISMICIFPWQFATTIIWQIYRRGYKKWPMATVATNHLIIWWLLLELKSKFLQNWGLASCKCHAEQLCCLEEWRLRAVWILVLIPECTYFPISSVILCIFPFLQPFHFAA